MAPLIKTKKNFKKVIFILLIILLIVPIALEALFAYHYYQNPRTVYVQTEKNITQYTSDKTSAEIQNDLINEVPKAPKDLKDLNIGGWVPDYSIYTGLNEVKNRQGTFNTLSPVWYYIQSDGSIQDKYTASDDNLISYATTNNIKLIPTFFLNNVDDMSFILNNKDTSNKLIGDIVSRADHDYVSGVDLDFELIYLKDKRLFLQFLTDLSTALKQKNKTLAFTALAKWNDFIMYKAYDQTRLVEDYSEIAQIVDELRIMVYEYTGKTPAKLGPIAPISWVELVTKYAIYKGVPRDKIVLAVATYSYEWDDRPLADSIDPLHYSDIFINPASKANAFYYDDIESLINNYGMQSQFYEPWGISIGRYQYQGQNRVVLFPNGQSINLQKQIAADYGLKGVIYWRLGNNASLPL